MIKSDVSAQYKTKECKKYAQNGYCPYGLRCQFIHGQKDVMVASPATSATTCSSYKEITVTDFCATFPAEVKNSLTPSGIDQTSLSGKNFFEYINVQNKSSKNQQIKQKKSINVATNCAKSAPYSEIVLHCINVSL